jgi:hypothetical protein
MDRSLRHGYPAARRHWIVSTGGLGATDNLELPQLTLGHGRSSANLAAWVISCWLSFRGVHVRSPAVVGPETPAVLRLALTGVRNLAWGILQAALSFDALRRGNYPWEIEADALVVARDCPSWCQYAPVLRFRVVKAKPVKRAVRLVSVADWSSAKESAGHVPAGRIERVAASRAGRLSPTTSTQSTWL